MKNIVHVMVLGVLSITATHADIFGTGANQFTIAFSNIGYAGNVADASGYGAVGYSYRIGRTEISIDQFFKARAVDDRIGDGDENYWNDGTRSVGIHAPVSTVSWFEAATFCNWLTTGDAYTGVYRFDGGGTLLAVDRTYRNGNGLAYVLPTEDEWVKAAYFKPDGSGYSLYTSGLDTVPIHGTSNGWNYYNGTTVSAAPNYTWQVEDGAGEQNETYNMMGNVEEWNQSAADGILNDLLERRTSRGGGYATTEMQLRSTGRLQDIPTDSTSQLGFRVASIPEPSSVLLLTMGAGGLLFYRRAKQRKKEQHMSRRNFQ